MRFSVKNQTGETWPAYGIARLGNVLRYDGPNADVALYDLKKPDGVDGIYVVNGPANLTTGNEGTAIHYSIAEYVLVGELTARSGSGASGISGSGYVSIVDLDDVIGAKSGKWFGIVDAYDIALFKAVNDENSTTKVAPVVPLSSGGTGSGGSGGCTCTCIDNGDILVNGIETTSKWSVPFTVAQEFEQANGKIVLPAATYVVTWDAGLSKWILDIGANLISFYNDGTSATTATTMDGELTIEWTAVGTKPILKLCVTGTVPTKPSGAGFSAGYSTGFADGMSACASVAGSGPAGSVVFGSFSGDASGVAEFDAGWADGYSEGYLAGAALCFNQSGSAVTSGSGTSGSGALPP